jgi:endonuclease/exonuclease/phosphatase family metal-dependent hydrolase
VGLRVMTWNVWWRFGPQWRERQAGILHTLRTVAPDVVAMQEVWGVEDTTQVHELGAALGLHAAFAGPALPPPPDPPEHADQEGAGVGVGLLSRWPIVRSRVIGMPAQHRDPAPVALLVELAHPDGPLHVAVACLEWEPEFDADRHAQADALAASAADPALDGPLPVLVAGDLNAAPDSPVLRPLHDVLTDAWSVGGGDPDAVTLSSTHPQAPLAATELIDRRIDHVLVRPGRPGQRVVVERAVLAGDPVDGLHPSDHRAVVCDLSWSSGP